MLTLFSTYYVLAATIFLIVIHSKKFNKKIKNKKMI